MFMADARGSRKRNPGKRSWTLQLMKVHSALSSKTQAMSERQSLDEHLERHKNVKGPPYLGGKSITNASFVCLLAVTICLSVLMPLGKAFKCGCSCYLESQQT